MSLHRALLVLSVALLATPAGVAPTQAAATSCESLAALTLPDTTITAATSVPAGPFVPPDSTAPIDVPAFCRVAGVIKPTTDSNIRFEVWMPTTSWNGKFHGGGNGGYGGSFATPARHMAGALARGYATAGTDMGHVAAVTPGARWALGHPEKVADWGHRANHVTAEVGKALVRAFYGTGPRLSYFTGCSDGGHEALMEAQRYPGDYDGIVAGASANFWTHQSAAWVWAAQATLKDPASYIPPSKLPMITQAAVAACDGLDGIVDGILDDPRRCDFDPKTLQCDGPDAATCLTAAQVEAVKKIYAGPRNPRTGEQLYPGLPPSSEFSDPSNPVGGSWTLLIAGPLPFLGDDFYKYMAFEDPTWDFRTLDFDDDIAFADAKMAPIIDSTNPDLTVFRARGGKLIMYHGWVDPLVNPQNSIDYYQSLVDAMGGVRETDEFLRLFMAPGMAHCRGGPGPNTFDTLTALEQWVEHGMAPDRIIAYHPTAGPALGGDSTVRGEPSVPVDRTRPLCPYPQVARWTGTGSTDDAANFVCELKGLDRGDEASGFDHGLPGRNNARRKQAR